MHILINASNLKAGGALQVADSLCGLLGEFPEHEFVVVLSRALRATAGCPIHSFLMHILAAAICPEG